MKFQWLGIECCNTFIKNYSRLQVQKKLFDGISIHAVGDLFQLKPVFDGWILEKLKHDYGPLALYLWRDNFQVYNLNEQCVKKIQKNLHVFE